MQGGAGALGHAPREKLALGMRLGGWARTKLNPRGSVAVPRASDMKPEAHWVKTRRYFFPYSSA